MTGPVRGVYTVTCAVCRAQVYASDTTPAPDPRALLTAFADVGCPRGGVGCPNTTAARDAASAATRHALARQVQDLQPRIATVTAVAGQRVVVSLDGATMIIQRVATYHPTVGDRVAVQRAGDTWIALGNTTV